jgi:rare lipoprotein A
MTIRKKWIGAFSGCEQKQTEGPAERGENQVATAMDQSSYNVKVAGDKIKKASKKQIIRRDGGDASPIKSSAVLLALLVVTLISQSCALLAPTDEASLSADGGSFAQKPAAPSVPRTMSQDTTDPGAKQPSLVQTGKASWYGQHFEGKLTASGEVFDDDRLTAARRTLPLGSRARVTNLENGKSVEVTINDRGPFAEGRIIDLSRGAARVLDMVKSGIARVRVESLSFFKDP